MRNRTTTITRRVVWLSAVALGTGLLIALVWISLRDEREPTPSSAAAPATAEQLTRGAYLARAGNCMACHTARGGTPYTGGRGIDTPFGKVYSGNLTPDNETGLGGWSRADFRRALHNGRSKDGRLLYPAFPYPSLTLVTSEDSDALLAWLQTLPPTRREPTPNTLRWPFSTQAALAIWRALYFEPGRFQPASGQSDEWNRGAYLVQGPGHCAACHAPRDVLGGTREPLALAGGLIPELNWFAPSLAAPDQAGVAADDTDEFVQSMKTGISPHGLVTGPMAEVVQHSTQHLSEADLVAMATYLKTLARPASAAKSQAASSAASATRRAGARLYEDHCVQCHGAQGQGVRDAYPPLARNRAVTMEDPTNLVQIVLVGGFPPATAGNPRPFGMPPFVLRLDDAEIAAVLSYVRSAWGNKGGAVTPLAVDRIRSAESR